MVIVFVALGVLAWSNRFIQDDAFISFRYAQNLARGLGLVWNAGERVEGYTNFLWTLLLCVPHYLNVDPIKFVTVLGLLLFEGSLYFTFQLGLRLLTSGSLALLTVVLLGTNFTFSSYATGGLETQLQAFLFISSLFLFFDCQRKPRSYGKLLLLSFIFSAAVLTRLDSLLLICVLLPLVLIRIAGLSGSNREKLQRAVVLLVPFVMLIGTWLIWKWHFYGSIIPNTFYVKVSPRLFWRRGLIYVYSFFVSYWLVVFPIMLAIFFRRLFLAANRAWLLLVLFIGAWLAYTAFIGGDFMEFRLIAPVMPLIFLTTVWLIFKNIRNASLQLALLALTIAGSIQFPLTFPSSLARKHDISTVKELSGLLYNERDDWVEIGQKLGEAFNHDPNVTIAVTAAGAIPYYSQLSSVDMLGLNDKWVAHFGQPFALKPGHERIATLAYLLQRRVNLLIGHPQMVPLGAPPRTKFGYGDFFVKITHDDSLPATARIVEIPINSKYKLRALYLFENELVDEVIRERGWTTFAFQTE